MDTDKNGRVNESNFCPRSIRPYPCSFALIRGKKMLFKPPDRNSIAQ